jgi:hypothetical protein
LRQTEKSRDAALRYLSLLKAEVYRELNACNQYRSFNLKQLNADIAEEQRIRNYYGQSTGNILTLFAEKSQRVRRAHRKALHDLANLEARLRELQHPSRNNSRSPQQTFKTRVIVIHSSIDQLRAEFVGFCSKFRESLKMWRNSLIPVLDAKKETTGRKLAAARATVKQLEARRDSLKDRIASQLAALSLSPPDGFTIDPDTRLIQQCVQKTVDRCRFYQSKTYTISDIVIKTDGLMERLDSLLQRTKAFSQKISAENSERRVSNWASLAMTLHRRAVYRELVQYLQKECDQGWKNVPPGLELTPNTKSALVNELDGLRNQIDEIAKEMTHAELEHAEKLHVLDEELESLLKETEE